MINIADSTPRYFSFYRTFDDLMNEYLRVTAIDAQRNRSPLYDLGTERDIRRRVPNSFPNERALTEIVNNFQEFSQKIDSGGSFKKSRIKLSEDKRFQFSFSLASKGLIRVAEYYNAEIASKYPTLYNSTGLAAEDITMVAGVVDLNVVLSKPLANNQAYFYVIINGKEYELRQQQKGTAKMLQINPSAQLKQVEGGGMYYTDPSFYQDFSLIFSSTFKKSYLELPKKGGNARAVDIYIPYDMLGFDVNGKITPAIPLLLASQYFQQARIKTRINIMRPILIGEQSPPPVSIVAITVKDFQDPIDWNKIAVLRGIESAGKVITEMNAGITAFNNNIYQGRTQSLGAYAGGGGYLLYDDEESLQTEFGRYKNWLRQEVEEGRIKTALVPKPLMLTFSTESLLRRQFTEEVARGVADPNSNTTQADIDRTNALIKQSFFELIDIVDLYYNEKIGEVVTRVKKRFDDEGKSSRELKNYFVKLLGKMYRDLEPDSGVYATPDEELKAAYDKYEETLQKLKKEYEKRGI
jgi:hypothetical protein